ncbi:hypothetical protein B0H19DRAFT_1253162 [Mycena capillaripes]|nr:hypothetical protein B0H19DRAFT_1253162 [Mycena capillaripes]
MSQASVLADAATTPSVPHFTYAGANFGGIPGKCSSAFDTKRIAAEYPRNTHPALPTRILHRVTFMDQLVQGDPASFISSLICQLKPVVRLQLVAATDVATVAALALQDPEKYIGCIVDVSGDAVTPRDLEHGWGEVFGVEMRPVMIAGSVLSWIVKTATKTSRFMFKFFNETRYDADISAAREMYPQLKT